MSQTGSSPFDHLRAALQNSERTAGEATAPLGALIRVDRARRQRTGVPEVVHAELKPHDVVIAALKRLGEASGRAMASRASPELVLAIRAAFEPNWVVEDHALARCVVVADRSRPRPDYGGVVGILSAGTSDVPVAAEAALMAAEMGATVLEAWDVGVAGLHRLVEPLEQYSAAGVDAIIVAAGMDGALPSVVAGLVDVPVIGLPTSVGYGYGGAGIGAMTSMLQSCAPGLVVVNIDNGIGAGSTAALIANRIGALRRTIGHQRHAQRVGDGEAG
jgi:NCAIR mutase (PurE)-related protein